MQTINLNQNSFRLFPTIYMVQNDTGRELKMILDDVTLDGTETGAVAIKRSDGSYYTITATIDTTNNAFDADMTQALTQPSRTECQLKVTASDDTVISTYTFIIMVQPSTDGISEEQLGYSVQQLRQDAEDIRAGGLPAALRLALLQIAQKVAYIDDQGAQYYQDLYDALVPSALLTGITAVYTQSGTVQETDSLDSLKADLVVTASYSDGTTETLPSSAYTLSGSLEWGESTITVTYEGETDTFTVNVSFVYTLNAFRGLNGAWQGSGGQDTKLETTSNNARASTDPIACILKPGTYEVSCPTAFYFGPHLTATAGASPSFEGVDFSNAGSVETFWSGTATRVLSAGWQNGTYTMTVTEESVFQANFKIGSAGTTAFNATYLAQLFAGFSVTRTA